MRNKAYSNNIVLLGLDAGSFGISAPNGNCCFTSISSMAIMKKSKQNKARNCGTILKMSAKLETTKLLWFFALIPVEDEKSSHREIKKNNREKKDFFAQFLLYLIFSVIMVFIYSIAVYMNFGQELVYQGINYSIPAEVCIFIYCLEFIFTILFICGAHKKLIWPVKIYFYFCICSLVSSALMQIVDIAISTSTIWSFSFYCLLILVFFCSVCVQSYIVLLVWSLLKKFEVDGPNAYENQLHQFVNGDLNVEYNGMTHSRTVPE
ncbi:unnamed protein product [Diatraea saccharalis]|uniref:Uncharacterized protein n=1 Tax=Diatraea saccharalis TaxID=40085 RepID=A0A9N9WBY2_9NEOP|nr:unnamed protein product [Diatraea saccharalis]